MDAIQPFNRVFMMERLLSQCRTRNVLLDTLISLVMIDSGVVQRLGRWAEAKAPLFWLGLAAAVMSLWRRLTGRAGIKACITKQCEVRSITPGMEINEIFPKIQWFIREQTKTDNEAVLHVQQGKADLSLVQEVPQGRQSVIDFQGVRVECVTESEVITIHADRDYRRTVHVIRMSAQRVQADRNIFQELINVACREFDAASAKRGWSQLVFRNEGSDWKSRPAPHPRRVETIVLPGRQMADLCDDFDEFLASEHWYLDHSVPYARGYMFYGAPGTGKSSTIQALAARAKRHIHYLMLSSVESDEQLFQLLKNVCFKSTVLVIEDIDCASTVTHARDDAAGPEPAELLPSKEMVGESSKDSKEARERLTLSGLLQAFDTGHVDTHGRIIIITTNRAQVLDPALVRAGRIDMKLQFANCTGEQAANMFALFFGRPAPSVLPDARVGKMSPAELAGIFIEHKKSPETAWALLLADEKEGAE